MVTPPVRDVLNESGFELKDGKVTDRMRKSLSKLANLLRCPLCDKIFDKPTTLSSCAHSFCVDCIDAHCCNSWTCPVKGCGMPMSIVGGHGGSFRKVNPQLSQAVESLKLICHSLNSAPEKWWLSSATIRSIERMHSEDVGGDTDSDMDDDYGTARRGIGMYDDDKNTIHHDVEDREMVDLQANTPIEETIHTSGGDNKYNVDDVSDDESVWES